MMQNMSGYLYNGWVVLLNFVTFINSKISFRACQRYITFLCLHTACQNCYIATTFFFSEEGLFVIILLQSISLCSIQVLDYEDSQGPQQGSLATPLNSNLGYNIRGVTFFSFSILHACYKLEYSV